MENLRLGNPLGRNPFIDESDDIYLSSSEAVTDVRSKASTASRTAPAPSFDLEGEAISVRLSDLKALNAAAPAAVRQPQENEDGSFTVRMSDIRALNGQAQPAPTEEPDGLLARVGKAVDETVTSLVGENKAQESQIDQAGLALHKAEQAEEMAKVMKRRAELGVDQDRGYAMQLFDSAAAGLAGAVGGTLEWIGETVESEALKNLGKASSREAAALTPAEQDTLQKVAGGVGSMLSFAAPGLGVVKVLPALGVGVRAARVAAAGTVGALESASIAQEAYDKAMDETGDHELARERAWTAGAVNLPVSWALNRFGLFGDAKSAATQIGRTMLGEGVEESVQEAITNIAGFKPTGEGMSESFAIGALSGGAFKGAQVAFQKWMETEATPEQKEHILKAAVDDAAAARQAIYDDMAADERGRAYLESAGIDSAEHPNFQKLAVNFYKLSNELAELDIKTNEERNKERSIRRAEVEEAYGKTGTTGIGIGTDGEPVIRRDSVTVDPEKRELVPLGEKAEPVQIDGVDGAPGTIAVAPEDMVAAQHEWTATTELKLDGKPAGNRFFAKGQAQSVADKLDNETTEARVREGRRPKDAGGGRFWFVETRPNRGYQLEDAGGAKIDMTPSGAAVLNGEQQISRLAFLSEKSLTEVAAIADKAKKDGKKVEYAFDKGMLTVKVDKRNQSFPLEKKPEEGMHAVWPLAKADGFGRSAKLSKVTRPAKPTINESANEAATSPANDRPQPTAAQKEAGNYKKGHVKLHGMDIAIENPRGSERSGTDPSGKKWSHTMSDHYGYVKRTKGADGDQVDVYVGPNESSQKVFIVDQINQKTGKFDEHKVMLGFDSKDKAVAAYKSNFDKGWKVGPVKEMSVADFKAWLKDGDTSKPAATTEVTTEVKPKATKKAEPKKDKAEPVVVLDPKKPTDDNPAQQPVKRSIKGLPVAELTNEELGRRLKAEVIRGNLDKDVVDEAIAGMNEVDGRAWAEELLSPSFSRKPDQPATVGVPHEPFGSIEDLNTHINRYTGGGFRAVQVRHGDAIRTVAGYGLIDRLARMLGKKVVFFRVESGFDFNGVVLSGVGNTIYVNTDADRAHLAIFGHELVHSLRRSNPQAYNSLAASLVPYFNTQQLKSYHDWLNRERTKEGKTEMPLGVAVEEAIADIVGDRMLEQSFWQQIANQNPTGFRAVADAFLKFLDAFVKRLKGLDSNRLLTDVDGARTAIANVLKNLDAARQQSAAPQMNAEPALRRKDADTDAFKQWFGKSTVTNEDGSPKVMYHGTAVDITKFRAKQAGAIFITDNPSFAADFAQMSHYWMLDNLEKVLTPQQIALATQEAKAEIEAEYQRHLRNDKRRDSAEAMRDESLEILESDPSDSHFFKMAAQQFLPSYENILPLYVRAEKPFDYENPKHIAALEQHLVASGETTLLDAKKIGRRVKEGDWRSIESDAVQAYIKANHDSFYVEETGEKNLAVLNANQLKSATGNNGEYSLQDDDIRFRRKGGDVAIDSLTPEENELLNRAFGGQKLTVMERIKATFDNLRGRIVQRLFDSFAPLKELDYTLYMKARLTKGIDGGVETLLHGGRVVYDGGALNVVKGSKGLVDVLKPLGTDVEQFLRWMALNRAANLKKQDREHWITDEMIGLRGKLLHGSLPDGKSRAVVYNKVLAELNGLNKSVLDLALQTGLIDKEAHARFSNDIWYIPFYRAMEGGDVTSVKTASSLVNQSFSKKLKGGERPINDLMENIVMNWNHILGASMKNKAAQDIMDHIIDNKLEGVVTKLSEPMKNAVRIMRDGKVEHYLIHDPAILDAVSSLHYLPDPTGFMKFGRMFKQALTLGVTMNPAFRFYRNAIRDAIHSIGVSELGYNPVKNVATGYKLLAKDSEERKSALAGGGLFTLGTSLEGDNAAIVRRLVARGVKDEQILNTPEKLKNGLSLAMKAYNDAGDRVENASRMALYHKLRKEGKSHLEASFAARDLMDFSLQGTSAGVRQLIQLIPFLNARLQGLYKLGRDGVSPTTRALYNTATGKEVEESDKAKAKRFGAVVGAVSLASVALYLAYEDDEDFQAREQWDRDNFWWFKAGDKQFWIPKPFEIGAFGTIAERSLEQLLDKDVEDKQIRKSLTGILLDTFSFNPVPQFVKPMIEVFANKDMHMDRQIESEGMRNLSPSMRYRAETTEIAKGLSAGMEAVVGKGGALSPLQVEHLVRGYLGWLGTTALSVADDAVKTVMPGRPVEAAPRLEQTMIMRAAFNGIAADLPKSYSKYVTDFYENKEVIDMAMADIRRYIALGQMEKAQDVLKEKRDVVAMHKLYSKIGQQMTELNKQMQMVQNSKHMDADAKRSELDRLAELRNKAAQLAERVRKERQQ